MTAPLPGFDLTGRVAVVTGGASGIGRASAHLMAASGAHVVLADRDESNLRAAVDEIGERASTAVVDVTDAAALRDLAGRTAAAHGRLDAWANVAGVVERATVADITEHGFDRVFDINFKGTLYGCQAALSVMTDQGSGSIVNTASAAIDTPAAGLLAYAVSKAAVVQLTKTLATEAGRDGIRVNAVAPGFIVTPMTSHWERPDGTVDEDARAALVGSMAAGSPLRTVGEANDIGYAILYLVSGAAKFVTGQVLRPNGGVAMPG